MPGRRQVGDSGHSLRDHSQGHAAIPVNEHITTTARFADLRAWLLPDTPGADPVYLIVDGRPLTLGFLPDQGLSCILAR